MHFLSLELIYRFIIASSLAELEGKTDFVFFLNAALLIYMETFHLQTSSLNPTVPAQSVWGVVLASVYVNAGGQGRK